MNTKNKEYVSASDAIKDIKGHLFFGDMIKSLRQCEEISQAALARKVEISRQYLCNIESGERRADVELAIKLADILNHPKEFFISRLLEDQLYIAGLDYKIHLQAS